MADGEHLRSQTSPEYCGVALTEQPDRYGPDHRPAGPAACARHSCSGCCYCRDVAPLPVYFEVRSEFVRYSPEPSRAWMTIDQLRERVDALASSRLDDATPVYLLCRAADGCYADRRALVVAGDVRTHVTAIELTEWAARLARGSIYLHVASSETSEVVLGPAEQQRIDTHVSEQREQLKLADAEWEASRAQASEWRLEVEHAARRGCGLRWPSGPGVLPSFRAFDVLYRPAAGWLPSRRRSVAITTQVCRAYGGGDAFCMPTGELDVLLFDCVTRRFLRRLQRERDVDWELLPPCCGRGAACPHLGQMEPELRQWSNGKHLDIRPLLAIPGAFREWLESVVPAVDGHRSLPSVPQHLCPLNSRLMTFGMQFCSCSECCPPYL